MSLKLLNILREEISEQGGKYKQAILPSGKRAGEEIGGLEFDATGEFKQIISPEDVGKRTPKTPVIDIESPDLYDAKPGRRRYGKQKHPITGVVTMHWGIDFGESQGTAYVIITDGEIMDASYQGCCGNSITVKHPNGVCTRVCHLLEMFVKKGDKITAGTVVGLVGSTGECPDGKGGMRKGSTGPHLHWEYKPGCSGSPQDPPDGSWNSYFKFSKTTTPKINKKEKEDEDEDIDGLTVVIGGADFATADYMKKQWIKAGLSTKNVKFINQGDSLPSGTITKIMGFSGGGSKVWKEIISNSSNYSFIGLIDPYTQGEPIQTYVNKLISGKTSLPDNVYSLCNYKNWGGQYGKTRDNLEKLEDNKILLRGDYQHTEAGNYPYNFFVKYKNILE
jgi:murein DD-endopeptidase MepM/ murein hydrolase activator NlpD